MILPCGVSSARKARAGSGVTLAISPVTRPLRKCAGVVAGDLDHAAVGEKCCLHAILWGPCDSLLPELAAKRKRCRQAAQGPDLAAVRSMADTYDLILKGGTVVNHDGEGVRDLGVRGGRIRRDRRPFARRPPAR